MYTDTAYDTAYGGPVRGGGVSGGVVGKDGIVHREPYIGEGGIYDRTYVDKRSYVANDIYGTIGGVNSSAPATSSLAPLGSNYGTSTSHYPHGHHHSSNYPQQINQQSQLIQSSTAHHQQQPYSSSRFTRSNDYKILVNVGGVRHELLWSTLEKFPFTRLGRLQECRTEDAILNYCDHYSYEENEYFFDKNPKIFQSVISCYRTGKLHIPDEFCLTELVTELRYWGFDENFLDMCCQQKYKNRKLLYQEMKQEAEAELWALYGYGNNNYLNNYPYNQMYDERFGVGQCAVYRKFLWDSFQNPRFSKRTKVLPMISIIFSILAVIAVALGSVESIKEKDKFGNVKENTLLSRLTMACFAWISIEWIMRMYSAPKISQFIFDICTIIDLLGCIVYFYTVIVGNRSTSLASAAGASPDRINDAWKMFLMFRSWRVPYMICKLLYDPSVLQLDRAILFNFNKQFGILFLFFITGVVMSSTAIYVAEKEVKDSPFTSIPETFWFAVATLTTSGNSFAYPTSTLGKYFTSLCSLVGVIFIAAVITIANFAKVLQNINANRMHNQSTSLPGQRQGVLPLPSTSGYPTGVPEHMAHHQQPQLHPGSAYSGAANRMTGSTTHHPPQAGLAGGFDEANSSYHHITFTDDLANPMGTVDVLVERDRKPIRETGSHTSNRVKTITLKIKMDPLGKATGSAIATSGLYGGSASTADAKHHLHHSTGLTGASMTTGPSVATSGVVTSTTVTGSGGTGTRGPVSASGQSTFHHSTNTSTTAAPGVTASSANERAYV